MDMLWAAWGQAFVTWTPDSEAVSGKSEVFFSSAIMIVFLFSPSARLRLAR